MFQRDINLPEKLSFFLFGARGTGKTTLLNHRLKAPKTHFIDLLLAKEEDRFRRSPDLLITLIAALPSGVTTVVIDEVQKIPKLLDVVHHILETMKRPPQFILTGSSARKLRHGGANLLAGRAFTRYLYPLTANELGSRFSLSDALSWGTLPRVYHLASLNDRREFLQSYAHTYLKEEIQAEQLVRRIDSFHRFLEVAAQSSGKLINFAKIARDTGVDAKTVKTFYEILIDTLLGFMLEPFHSSRRKRLRTAPKFYFIDTGISRALARHLMLEPHPSTAYYGELFEQFVISELYRQEQYANRDYRLSFLRTQDDAEVDLVIERPGKALVLVEIKSTTEIKQEAVRGLMRFAADFPEAECMVWSQDRVPQSFGKIRALPWREGLRSI